MFIAETHVHSSACVLYLAVLNKTRIASGWADNWNKGLRLGTVYRRALIAVLHHPYLQTPIIAATNTAPLHHVPSHAGRALSHRLPTTVVWVRSKFRSRIVCGTGAIFFQHISSPLPIYIQTTATTNPTSWKVAGSRPDEVNEFSSIDVIFPVPLDPGVTQPPREMSTRNRKIMFLRSRARPVRIADKPTVICEPTV
jgi:hypothetical protein